MTNIEESYYLNSWTGYNVFVNRKPNYYQPSQPNTKTHSITTHNNDHKSEEMTENHNKQTGRVMGPGVACEGMFRAHVWWGAFQGSHHIVCRLDKGN